jgi:hypothetical protein
MMSATAMTEAARRNQIGQPAAWMMLNTRVKSQAKTKFETLATQAALSKASRCGMRAWRSLHASGIDALSTVVVDKVVNSVSALVLSGPQVRRFRLLMKM